MLAQQSFEFLSPSTDSEPTTFVNAISDLLDQIKTGIDRCESQEMTRQEPMPRALRTSIMDQLL